MRRTRLLVIAPVAALAAACGGSSTTASPPPQSGSAGHAHGAGQQNVADAGGSTATDCATSDLRIALGSGQGAAGSEYRPLTFTNTASASCTMRGYPGVSFVSQDETQVGAAATRNAQHDATTVTLAPGDAATAIVQIANTSNYPPASCSAADATALRVYPPNQTDAATVPLDATTSVCSADVGQLSIEAVEAASAGM
jgi:hypothetical protein